MLARLGSPKRARSRGSAAEGVFASALAALGGYARPRRRPGRSPSSTRGCEAAPLAPGAAASERRERPSADQLQQHAFALASSRSTRARAQRRPSRRRRRARAAPPGRAPPPRRGRASRRRRDSRRRDCANATDAPLRARGELGLQRARARPLSPSTSHTTIHNHFDFDRPTRRPFPRLHHRRAPVRTRIFPAVPRIGCLLPTIDSIALPI